MSDASIHPSTETAFLGLPFTRLNFAGAVAAVSHASRGNEWRYVVTPNADHLARLNDANPALQRIYLNAAFCFLDSRVIALVARFAGLHTPPVVTGADLVDRLFRHKITPATPICVIGGTDLAIGKIRAQFGLTRLTHMNPSLGFWRNEEEVARVVDFVVASGADYTFLVVGSPQQEILASRIAAAGGARGVGICAGAAIDFITGAQRRAPRLLQWIAMEWAYRLAFEPARLGRRYLVESPKGIRLVLRHTGRCRAGRGDRKNGSSGSVIIPRTDFRSEITTERH